MNTPPPYSFTIRGKTLTSYPDRPHEVDSRYLEADGVKRMLKQSYLEILWWWAYTANARRQLFSDADVFHSITRLIVESLRCAPYLWGHVASFGFFVSLAVWVWGWF